MPGRQPDPRHALLVNSCTSPSPSFDLPWHFEDRTSRNYETYYYYTEHTFLICTVWRHFGLEFNEFEKNVSRTCKIMALKYTTRLACNASVGHDDYKNEQKLNPSESRPPGSHAHEPLPARMACRMFRSSPTFRPFALHQQRSQSLWTVSDSCNGTEGRIYPNRARLLVRRTEP